MNREGFYSIHYNGSTAGSSGVGMGMLILDSGIIVGCDMTGGTFDGTYEFNEQTQMVEARMLMRMPPGSFLVTGVSALPHGFPINASLSRRVRQQEKIFLNIPGGQISVVITKLRDFPD